MSTRSGHKQKGRPHNTGEMTYEEIAKVEGITSKGVHMALQAALRKLRRNPRTHQILTYMLEARSARRV